MRSPRPLLLVALVGTGLALSACTGTSASDDATPAVADEVDGPAATATPVPDSGPAGAFSSWWTAVRAADTVAACGALTDELQQRVIAEYNASTGLGVADCETLVRQTAALYDASGIAPDVQIDVVSEQGDDAVLEVSYATGGCGTVHLDHRSGTWTVTELRQECAQG